MVWLAACLLSWTAGGRDNLAKTILSFTRLSASAERLLFVSVAVALSAAALRCAAHRNVSERTGS